jgi:hypothetical protein
MMIHETLWSRTFACFPEAVGSALLVPADCAVFRMLDALCGHAGDRAKAMLLDKLDLRSCFFLPKMRVLINAVATSSSVRRHVADYQRPTMCAMGLVKCTTRRHCAEPIRCRHILVLITLPIVCSTLMYLGRSMRVRFGPNSNTVMVDVYGWSSPLLYNRDGQVEVTNIRLVISTPWL